MFAEAISTLWHIANEGFAEYVMSIYCNQCDKYQLRIFELAIFCQCLAREINHFPEYSTFTRDVSTSE